jgi:hypothetical protein
MHARQEVSLAQDPDDKLYQNRGRCVCDDMSDEEYLAWLAALARKHLLLGKLTRPTVERAVERLSSAARFAKVVRDRIDSSQLVKELAEELREVNVNQVVDALDNTGVLDALDELPEVTFGQLRRSAIPEDDARPIDRSIAQWLSDVLFLHAQPFEITQAKKIKNTIWQQSCQNAKVVDHSLSDMPARSFPDLAPPPS